MVRLYRGQKISQMILDRQAAEDHLAILNRAPWYTLNESLVSEALWSTFHLSFLDPDTQSFLDTSTATSGSMCLQMWYSLMTTVLSVVLSKTSINGVLNRGGMFLFSESQLRDFLQISPEWNPKDKVLLDLGAGDGGITKVTSQLFREVHATEMSQVMQWRLRSEGFHIEDVEKWTEGNRKYDMISVLNLLDRHYNPRLLLSSLHSLALRSQCPILMAVVLPVRQYVEFHPKGNTTRPDVSLHVSGSTFEEHASSLVQNEFIPAGFEVIRWTKLPYLCEGDFKKPFYLLSDAVFLLRAKPIQNPTGSGFPSETHVFHEEL